MWLFFHLLFPHCDPFLPEREQGGAAAQCPLSAAKTPTVVALSPLVSGPTGARGGSCHPELL